LTAEHAVVNMAGIAVSGVYHGARRVASCRQSRCTGMLVVLLLAWARDGNGEATATGIDVA
jgi:hypothetical protein